MPSTIQTSHKEYSENSLEKEENLNYSKFSKEEMIYLGLFSWN